MQTETFVTTTVLASLALIIFYLIEIRAALVKRNKVVCWYCKNYFPRKEIETYGPYTYCSQHGLARQKRYV